MLLAFVRRGDAESAGRAQRVGAGFHIPVLQMRFAELFDIEAIADAIVQAPEDDEAIAVARAFNRTGPPLAFRRAIDAVQVLRLALQVTGAS